MRILMAGFIVIGILIPISALGGRPIPANAAPTPTFAVNSQNPTGAAANPSNYPYTLNSISCPSSSWCAGVGDWWEVHTVGGYTSPMAQIWSGGTWSTSITGDYLRDTDLDGVSCVSASFCAAVGDTNTAWTPYQAAYAEIWNGSAWNQLTVPAPNGGNYPSTAVANLTSVSCVTATDCTAVGSYSVGSGNQAIISTYNGSAWSTTEPTNSSSITLNGVSCILELIATVNCWMAGSQTSTNGNSNTLIEESQLGGIFTSITSLNPNTNQTLRVHRDLVRA